MQDLRHEARALVDMALLALNHAFRDIADGSGPMMPFVMADSDSEGRAIYRFEANSLGHAFERAHLWLERVDREICRYAFAWDGYVTLDDVQVDALFVEAGDRTLPHGLILCQCYMPDDETGTVHRRIGEPVIVERPESRLAVTHTRH